MDHSLIKKRRVYNLIDRIESKMKTMAQDIPAIKEEVRLWQDGNLTDQKMINKLTKYIDLLNYK